jgi:hypothetical protein
VSVAGTRLRILLNSSIRIRADTEADARGAGGIVRSVLAIASRATKGPDSCSTWNVG